jgi:hypothetical protein
MGFRHLSIASDQFDDYPFRIARVRARRSRRSKRGSRGWDETAAERDAHADLARIAQAGPAGCGGPHALPAGSIGMQHQYMDSETGSS